MASSCQSMIHTHIVPRKSKEGDFIVPVFDSPEFTDSFTPIELDPNSKLNALQITCEHLVSDEKAPLLINSIFFTLFLPILFSIDSNSKSN